MRVLRIGTGIPLAVSLVLTAACSSGGSTNGIIDEPDETVVGSGVIVSQGFAIGGVNAFVVVGDAEVTIVQGATESLTITGEDNILDRLVVGVLGGELRIAPEPNTDLQPSVRIRIELSVVSLARLEIVGSADVLMDSLATGPILFAVVGSADIDIDDLEATAVSTSMVGSGSIELDGCSDTHTAFLSGNGEIDADELGATTADVGLIGNGSISIGASLSLEVEIVGNGSVSYRGSPTVNVISLGSGTLDQIDVLPIVCP